MATQAVGGRRASLDFGTTAVPSGVIFSEVRNWSIEPTQEMIDASSADSSGWNEFIPGQRGWVFRAETVYVPNGTVAGSDIRYILKSLFASGARRITRFRLRQFDNTGGVASGTWSAYVGIDSTGRSGFVTNARVGGTYDSLQLFEFEITGDGVLTYSSA